MSRKWERMVEKNKSTINKQRSKQGVKPISEQSKEKIPRVLGRNWSLPILLLGVSFFFMLSMSGNAEYQKDGMYWVTVGGYILLALFIFFVRRPYLKISATTLATRKWSGEKYLQGEDIENIIFQKGYVIINPKSGKGRWIFSKFVHRYNTDYMADMIRPFAAKHSIVIQDERNGEKK